MNSTRALTHLMPFLVVAAAVSSRAAEVSTLPPSSRQAAFAAEAVDAEWSARKSKEIADTLSGVSSSVIECKSSTCRATLTWAGPAAGESWEQFTQRVAQWTRDVSVRGGFVTANTDLRRPDLTTVSYFSVQQKQGEIALPPGLAPESAAALRQCIRDSAEQYKRQNPAESAAPQMYTCIGSGATSTPGR